MRGRWYISLLMLALAFVAAGVFIVVPRLQSAHAAGATLTVSPKSIVYAASSVISVKGSQYAASESVKIYWNYTGPGTGTLETTATADATGAFTTKIFPVPLSATGTYTIAGVGATSGDVATDTVTLLPQLYTKPEAAGPGTGSLIHVYANAFGNTEQVNLYWNYTGPGTGTLLKTVAANTTGSFNTTVNVPTTATPGTYPLVGVGQTSNTTAGYSVLIYPATLTLAPQTGSAGSTLTLSAYGFKEDEAVNVFWNNGSTPILVVKTNGNVYGYMPPSAITIPAGTAPGTYPVTVVGKTSKIYITSNYTVVGPASSLNITSGPVNAAVTVSGQGYAAGELVKLVWNYTGPGTGAVMAKVTASSSGSFAGHVFLPASATTPGTFAIAAVGNTSGLVSQNNFTIVSGAEVSPTIAPPNTTFTVNGTGFTPHEVVHYYWDNTSDLLLSAGADSLGNVRKILTIPATAAPGAHTLILNGLTSNVTFSVPVTVDTSWGSFGFTSASTRANVYENSLNNTNVANLQAKWNNAIGAGLSTSAVYNNGTVYITTPDGKLDAYNATTGASDWQFDSQTGFKNVSSPLVDPAAGLVFFGTMGYPSTGIPSPFYAVDAQTGALKWSIILPWNIVGAPSLSGSTLYIGVSRGPNTSSVYALDETTGRVVWHYAAAGGVWSAVSVDSSANVALFFTGNPTSATGLVALNATTGALLWKFAITISQGTLYNNVTSGIAIANGLAYFDAEDGTLYAVNESTGTKAWSASTGSPTSGSFSTPAVANAVVYVGSPNSNLYAFNASTGALIWETPTGGEITSSPAVANGVVYVASADQHIYAMDTTSGSILWNFATTGPSSSSPIVANGWLYCGSSDGNLYAFGL
jgi:outer membrane protein assembly factor BamB